MKRLSDCPISPEERRRRPPYVTRLVERKGGKRSRPAPRSKSRVEDARSGQVLEITSDEPLVAYGFPDEGPGRIDFPGARPDGVVLATLDGRSSVVFIELKSTGSDGKAEHGVKQVRAGALHFAPFGRRGGPRGHGDDHHDAWSKGDDLPPVDVLPGKDHMVIGIAVVFRSLPRDFEWPAPERIAGKEVTWATVHVHMSGMNEATIDLRDLLAKAQIPGVIEASPPRRKK